MTPQTALESDASEAPPSLFWQDVSKGLLDEKGEVSESLVLEHYACQADAIYIDGAHEREAVLADLRAYWPLLRPRGVLFGDDFLWSSVSHDVKRFTEERNLDLVNLDGNTWAIVKP